MGSIFTIFGHLTELWVSFSGDFSLFPELSPRFSFNLRNYDPKIHQNLWIYWYQFFGQNGTSPSESRSRYPPPRGYFSQNLNDKKFDKRARFSDKWSPGRGISPLQLSPLVSALFDSAGLNKQ